ncbi:hypothetical protein D3C79_834900 [compost metagenome]
MHAVRVHLGKLVSTDVCGNEQRRLRADKPALLHRGAVAVVQDVDVSQVFQRRLVDARVVVLGAIEAKQDVVEGAAILVERRDLAVAVAVFGVDALDVAAINQQQHAVLGARCALQAVRAEHGHALQQADIDQALHAIDHLLVPVDDRLGAVVVNQRAAALHVSHRGHALNRREVNEEPAPAGVQAFAHGIFR